MRLADNLNLIRKNLGFTLIEMVVSLAILMVLGTASFVGFNTYNKTAKLNSAANDIRSTLNVAKSYALSQQIVSTICNDSGKTLVGYQVQVYTSSVYYLKEICSDVNGSWNWPIIKTFNLPSGVVALGVPTGLDFYIQSRGNPTSLSTNLQIVISAGGSTRTITVTPDGTIK